MDCSGEIQLLSLERPSCPPVQEKTFLASCTNSGLFGQAQTVVCAVSCRRKLVPGRSEEHTSELQSQSNLVCRLLLEKKKIISRSRGVWEPRPTILEPTAFDAAPEWAASTNFAVITAYVITVQSPPHRSALPSSITPR